MKNYAIIGAGMMAGEHIRNLALVEDIRLVGLSDPHPQSLINSAAIAKPFFEHVNCYEHPKDMFSNEDIDAVIISSPNFTHYQVLKDVMKHNVAILLEKPMCTTEKDSIDIYQAVKSYPALFWVGMEYRFMPPVTKFIEHVHAGIAGPIRMLTIREHRFPFLVKVGDWNRLSRNTGGTLVEKCCHFFDLMRFILQDEPVRIYASGGQDVNHLDEVYNGEPSDILDAAYVVLDFKKGTRAVLDLCMYANNFQQEEELYAIGHKGKLEVKIPAGNVSWAPRSRVGGFDDHISVPEEAMRAGDHHGATYFQLQRFHSALKSGGKPDLTALDGLRSVQIGLAAHQSIDTGLPVALDFSNNGDF